MTKKCDKCKNTNANVSYTETVNGKTQKLSLCSKCAHRMLGQKELFLHSFFNLDPFREIDEMFDTMFMPSMLIDKPVQKPTAKPQKNSTPKPQANTKEELLRKLKEKVDTLKQEEGIAVMLQDYMKAAEIKKKREKLQKEAEKIINQ